LTGQKIDGIEDDLASLLLKHGVQNFLRPSPFKGDQDMIEAGFDGADGNTSIWFAHMLE
jgi:hypothetical protein